nr:PREDICTED: uncharacterized protein LOC109029564 [Bemisia tabaci]
MKRSLVYSERRKMFLTNEEYASSSSRKKFRFDSDSDSSVTFSPADRNKPFHLQSHEPGSDVDATSNKGSTSDASWPWCSTPAATEQECAASIIGCLSLSDIMEADLSHSEAPPSTTEETQLVSQLPPDNPEREEKESIPF